MILVRVAKPKTPTTEPSPTIRERNNSQRPKRRRRTLWGGMPVLLLLRLSNMPKCYGFRNAIWRSRTTSMSTTIPRSSCRRRPECQRWSFQSSSDHSFFRVRPPNVASLLTRWSSISTSNKDSNDDFPTTTKQQPPKQSNVYGYTDGEIYNNYVEEENDTIFALSTGISSQPTALAVIRITGPHSKRLLEHMLLLHSPPSHSNQQRQKPLRPRYASLRTLYNWRNGDVLDQSIVIYFPGPNSFTGEDIIEIHCHGSRAVIQYILQTLREPITLMPAKLSNSDTETNQIIQCRLAEPGEFAQRAWMNGKLDLLQVEALSDLLLSDTSQQLQQAMRQLDGSLSKLYDTWRSLLIESLAHAEAIIDFGDDENLLPLEDDDDNDEEYDARQQAQQQNIWGDVLRKVQGLRQSMQRHLQDSRRGELVREGLLIAILGPPNVGKSSLFNILAQRDAAIVSSVAGTTRDIIEITFSLNGYKCIIQDTAGVREQTMDTIELEGMKRAIDAASKADIIISMIDSTSVSTIRQGITILEKVVSKLTKSNNNNQGIESDDDDVITNETMMYEDNAKGDENSDNLSTLLMNLPKNIMIVLNKGDAIVDTTTVGHNGNDNSDDIMTNSLFRQLLNKDNERDGRTVNGIPPLDVSIPKDQQQQQQHHLISCMTQDGIEPFLNDLTYRVSSRINGNDDDNDDENNSSGDGAIITRARHRQHIEGAVVALERFHQLATPSVGYSNSLATADLAAEELRLAASELGRITGAVDVEDVLDKLFSDFCIGK